MSIITNLTKKKIYLDQNFISNISKSDEDFREIFNLLHRGFIDEKLVVPRSYFHKIETELANQYKNVINSHQGYLGQIKLQSFNHIFSIQAYRAATQFLKKPSKPYSWPEAYRDDPNQKLKQFHIGVDMGIWEGGEIRQDRVAMAKALNEARLLVGRERRSFGNQCERELEAQRQLFLRDRAYTVERLFNGDKDKIIEFSKSKYFSEIPYIDIICKMWSGLFVYHNNRNISESDNTDIEVIATYLPYLDVFATDSFMAEQIKQRKLDTKFKTKIFAANKTGLKNMARYLNRSLPKKKSANWPQASILVIADDKIKENSWEFFRKLGNQSRGDQRGNGWIEIYAFDDGSMPSYPDTRIKNTWPFYGMQDIDVISIDKPHTRERIIAAAKQKVRTKQFVTIDSYREIPDNFAKTLITYCGSGKTKILNYKIYSTD